MLLYVTNYLDRVNVGFAALTMNKDLGFSATVYGFAASIFFVSYAIFQIPATVLLERMGARRTVFAIMTAWGALSAATAFVHEPIMFYVLRFLLGVAEAGFFPGIILYLTFWYPSARRGQMIAIFMAATTVANVIAGPLCGGIMKWMDGVNGWHGWQWLFLVQGVPASVLGVVAFLYLRDKPEDATWLDGAEKKVLRDHLDHDKGLVQSASHGSSWQLLKDPRVYTLSLVYFLLLGATYTMIFWLPTLIKSWGINDLFMIGIYSAIPSVFGVIGMVLIGRSSDRRKERRWHFAICAALSALGLFVTTQTTGNFIGSMIGLCIATVGISAATPLFFTASSEYLPRQVAAVGLALISSLGNLGPALFPAVTGAINAATGNPVNSMYLVVALYFLAGAIMLGALRAARAV